MRNLTRRILGVSTVALLALLMGLTSPSHGVEEATKTAKSTSQAGLSKATKSEVKGAVDQGLRYLRGLQTPEGRWQMMGHDDPGVTALAITAFLHSHRAYTTEDGPFIRKPLEYIASLARENGGIYQRGLANYVTCVSIMALAASGEPKYKPLIKKAQSFLITLQADEGEGYRPDDKFYGGAGYGGDERPDLSNMSFWMEGVRAGGEAEGKAEALRKAMKFLNRCQNHSETNTETWKNPRTGEEYVSGNDGGASYYPGDSKAGFDRLPSGKLVPRSYGSMSYALLKCYLFAGIDPDDPRLEALTGWISDNFGFEENPGFDTDKDPTAGYQGYYYYLYSAARALDALGQDTITDGDGIPRNWREELARKLLALQQEDGSWVNQKNERWWEGEPLIASCYALLALEICYGSAPK